MKSWRRKRLWSYRQRSERFRGKEFLPGRKIFTNCRRAIGGTVIEGAALRRSPKVPESKEPGGGEKKE